MDYQEKIKKELHSLSGKRQLWKVWCDFIEITAISIANASSFQMEREQQYLKIIKGYEKEEIEQFSKMFSFIVLALQENQEQDFLGELYMNLNMGGNKGQFFTPYSVSKMMASLVIEGNPNIRNINDPACGAGSMLIAAANSAKEKGINYQMNMIFVGQDIDYIVGLMCYIQLSLIGAPGYVVIGNTLTDPISQLTSKKDIWYTPFHFLQTFTFVNN